MLCIVYCCCLSCHAYFLYVNFLWGLSWLLTLTLTNYWITLCTVTRMTVLLYIHITTDLRSESFVLWWQLIVGSSGIILRHKELKTIPLMHVVRVWNERGSPTGWVWNDRSFSCDTNQIRCPISWLGPVWLLLALTGQTTACPWIHCIILHNL